MSMSESASEKWDVVIIGSGVGGLMTGALLAKYTKKKVLVLEKYEKIGGCTHVYKRRKDYIFDVGVHYIGWLEESSPMRKTLDHLTNHRLRWKPLPNQQDWMYFPEDEYNIYSNRQDFYNYLRERFPHEEKNLKSFFLAIKKTARAFYLWQMAETLPRWAAWSLRKIIRRVHKDLFKITTEVLDRFFQDKKIKALLTCHWSSLGVTPKDCSFGFFASGFETYTQGVWYPEGGGEMIPREFTQVIESHGGEVRTGQEVLEILVEKNTARGVRLDRGVIAAGQVISAAGARSTYLKLLQNYPVKFSEQLARCTSGISYVMVSLGLDKHPSKVGINSANHWLFADYDYSSFFPEDPELEFINNLYVSSPSIKRQSDAHTIEVLILAPYEKFQQWKNSSWRKRPEEYTAYKKKIYDRVVELIDQRFSCFADSVLFSEVSTPLTVEHFIAGSSGSFGTPGTPERLTYPWTRARTPIKNLYLAGSDVFSWSILGTMTGALKTFRLVSQGSSWDLSLDSTARHLEI